MYVGANLVHKRLNGEVVFATLNVNQIDLMGEYICNNFNIGPAIRAVLGESNISFIHLINLNVIIISFFLPCNPGLP